MSIIRILIADGHAVTREGVKALVNALPDMRVIGEAPDGLSAVRLAAELNPDVVLTEVLLPGLGGAELAAELRTTNPTRKVIALTVCEDADSIRRLVTAGAVGYVPKCATVEQLLRAIRTVAAGGTYLDFVIAGGAVGEVDPPDGKARGAELSARETEVVRLIALGYSNKEIAARLRVSVKTVETYKARSMEKLQLRSRVDIVRYAARRGWLNSVGASDATPQLAPVATAR